MSTEHVPVRFIGGKRVGKIVWIFCADNFKRKGFYKGGGENIFKSVLYSCIMFKFI